MFENFVTALAMLLYFSAPVCSLY